jgi:hypothetical protein
MKKVKSLFAGSVIFAFAAGACGGSNHTGPGNREDLSQLTPAELCQQKCDLQVAANCPKMPPDYASSCALLCQAKYDKSPSCVAASHALDACAIQRVSYRCDEGVISAMPVGACASEGAACAACTGSFLDCL